MTVTDWPARTWTLRNTSARPLTVNAVVRLHRQAWATHTREVRGEWWLLALEAKVAHLDRIRLTATPLQKDRRWTSDVAAVAPEVKAAVDGLVDAGVIHDDGPAHLLSITFLPPQIAGVDGLQLDIEEVAA